MFGWEVVKCQGQRDECAKNGDVPEREDRWSVWMWIVQGKVMRVKVLGGC